MYVLGTLFCGWIILTFIINVFEFILNVPNGFIWDYISAYIVIGYLVMSFYQINSPLMKVITQPNNVQKIDIKLFFYDIYYAIWWPYYILRNLK